MRTPPRMLPALITPFAGDGRIDEDAHRHNLSKLHAGGVGGFVIAGSTGQGPYLLPGERGALIGIGREDLGPEAFLVCGIQAESVVQASGQIEEAAARGADAALVMTPTSLIRGKDEKVALFYEAVADVAPLPVLLYSVPATTGYQLPVEVAAGLAAHPNIVGMKDSNAEADRVPPLSSAIADGFLVFVGSSRGVNAFVGEGAHGAITASANYAADLVRDALDDEDAQARLTALAGAVEPFGLAGTYAAAAATGLIAGAMRLPLQPLDEAAQKTVAALLA